jgi:hypothetical protein
MLVGALTMAPGGECLVLMILTDRGFMPRDRQSVVMGARVQPARIRGSRGKKADERGERDQ